MEVIGAFLLKYWKELSLAIATIAFYFTARHDGKASERAKNAAKDLKQIKRQQQESYEAQKTNRKIADDILSDPDSGFHD
jgi:hypothetical protein